MKRILPGVLAIVLLLAACTHEKIDDPIDELLFTALKNTSATNDIRHYILPEATDLANIPQDIQNPLTPEKATLGQMLFYESCFSAAPAYEIGKYTYSCASCHLPTAGLMPGRIQGIADGGEGFGENGESRGQNGVYDASELDVQGIRPLSLYNVAYMKNTTWAGQFGASGVNVGTEALWGVVDTLTITNKLGLDGLEAQNISGLNLHRMVFTKELVEATGYVNLFDAAFPEMPLEERYTTKAASFAISAYLRTQFTNRAPFQEYLRGDLDALNEEEKNGALLFFGKAGCYRCHRETNLGAVSFYAVGVNDLVDAGGLNTSETDKKNLGRGGFTGAEEDKYKFRVPQLYNLKDAAYLFHGSSKKSIREVVEYFNAGVPENPRVPAAQITPYLKPLNLSETEVNSLVAFLTNGLYDAQMDRYVPDEVLSGNCFPNNDSASRHDLGCD